MATFKNDISVQTTPSSQYPETFEMGSPTHFISTASDEREAVYLRNRNLLNRARIALAVVVLAASLAIVGCTAHPLHIYGQTHLSVSWWLPLWPEHFELRATRGLLGCAVVMAVVSVGYLGVAMVPSPRPRTTLLNHLAALTGTLSLFLSIFSVVFFEVLDGKRDTDTLLSWTCRWNNTVKGAPTDFGRICAESRFSIYTMIILIAFSFVMLGLAAVGFVMEKNITKARALRQEEKGGVEELS
ncbi:MAG: hypothetical protein M1827_006095 [Pycnora praestabilis]|nr:MAG: hypothetical protein M1827_006095 [Pycnora praestabilis]